MGVEAARRGRLSHMAVAFRRVRRSSWGEMLHSGVGVTVAVVTASSGERISRSHSGACMSECSSWCCGSFASSFTLPWIQSPCS